jgi:hypothetical protein
MFKRADWTLYRSLSTLGQKAGVAAREIPKLVAKELVDNALDAGGRCRVGFLGDNGFWVEGDGDGIQGSDDQIATLFSIRRPLTSTKTVRNPSRGALGNGLRVVMGAVLSTDGRLTVSTRGRTLELEPQETTGRTTVRRAGEWTKKGCRIEVRFGPSVPVGPDALEWGKLALGLAAGGSSYEGKSSPHWYDSEAFYEFLQASGKRTIRDLVAEFQGCAEPKAGKIAAGFQGREARSLNRVEADRLLMAARAVAKAPKAASLGQVGRLSALPPGYSKISGTVTIGSPRSAIKAILPLVVEVWAQTADETAARLFVNRTPITGELNAWKEKTALCLSGCGVYLEIACGKPDIDLWINIQIPHMPITTDGKEPDLGPFGEFIRAAVSKATGIAKRKASVARGTTQTKKDVVLENLDAGVEKAGEGALIFSQRQLYYAVREPFIEVIGEEPDWSYFCQLITDYENEQGDIPGMYRDPRGTIYHPHLGTEIPLGTLYVKDYKRPPWLFKNVLYCEKEGFFPILRAVKWPERNDCALMTSKGFSSRAARDFIDLLVRTQEACQFFCIHDADAAGTMIYQTLQEATKARAARTVKIINLGLEPAEARDMGLQVERVIRKKKKEQPVARYVPPNDRLWLQSNRIELNAMTTREFLAWLDRKFAPYAGKVIPPDEVLRSRLEDKIRRVFRKRYTSAILRKARLDERVERAVSRRADVIAAAVDSLPDQVRRELERQMVQPWVEPVDRLARAIASRALSQK